MLKPRLAGSKLGRPKEGEDFWTKLEKLNDELIEKNDASWKEEKWRS